MTQQLSLACIVEGEGEVKALPQLIRRIFLHYIPDCWPEITRPIDLKGQPAFFKQGELERAVQLAARKASAILILLDADDACPAELAKALKERAVATRSDIPMAVVVANREYEAWFIASAHSLSLSANEVRPEDPEVVRGAKEWVARRLPKRAYSPTTDQAALSAKMSLEEARRARSFDKLVRELISLAGRAAT